MCMCAEQVSREAVLEHVNHDRKRAGLPPTVRLKVTFRSQPCIVKALLSIVVPYQVAAARGCYCVNADYLLRSGKSNPS